MFSLKGIIVLYFLKNKCHLLFEIFFKSCKDIYTFLRTVKFKYPTQAPTRLLSLDNFVVVNIDFITAGAQLTLTL